MANLKRTDTERISTSKANTAFIICLFGLMWGVFLINQATSSFGFNLNSFGITPRTAVGTIGIISSPLLHVDFAHIVGNSTTLLTFLALLIATQPKTWLYIPILWISSGFLLWLFGPSQTTVGASGLIYAAATFIITIGFVERDFLNATLGLFCAFLYGASLVSGILGVSSEVSWQAHLLGGIAGITVALAVEGISKRAINLQGNKNPLEPS